MKHINTSPLYQSLKLTRNLINLSFFIIFIVLLFWGNHNPAAAFAMIFYNALHWLLLSNKKERQLSELSIFKLTFTAAILLHLILGYGFIYRLPIKIKELKTLPFILTAVIFLFRYTSYFFIKIKDNKK
ncbi:MAG: hypothetical protein ACTTG8_07085 [Catonella sp.]|uniref:hypothetical protein n=1 Tax=Catonella sp. TaxID=2382125 RepID=UPI003FA17043